MTPETRGTPRRRALIGPELYPAFTRVLKLVLAVVAATAISLGAVRLQSAASKPRGLLLILRDLNAWLFMAGGWTTIVFALLDRRGLTVDSIRGRLRPRRAAPAADMTLGFEVVAGLAFLLLWTTPLGGLIPLGDSRFRLVPAPIWQAVRWPVAAVAALRLAVNFAAFAGPEALWLRRVLTPAAGLATVAVIAWIIRARHWVEVVSSALSAPALLGATSGVNIGLGVTLGLFLAAAIGGLIIDVMRLARPPRPIDRQDVLGI